MRKRCEIQHVSFQFSITTVDTLEKLNTPLIFISEWVSDLKFARKGRITKFSKKKKKTFQIILKNTVPETGYLYVELYMTTQRTNWKNQQHNKIQEGLLHSLVIISGSKRSGLHKYFCHFDFLESWVEDIKKISSVTL